jgi:hypothetical protein
MIFHLEEYSENIFNKFKHLNIKKANNTFDLSVKLSNNYDKISQLEYVNVFESIMYVTHWKGLNITFFLCKLSIYMCSTDS